MRQWINFAYMRGLGKQMNDDLGVGRALEDVTLLFILAAQERGVHEISVVRHRNRTHVKLAQQRLRVAELARARRRVAHMPDRRATGEIFTQSALRKDLADESHIGMPAKGRAVG